MTEPGLKLNEKVIIERENLQALLDVLQKKGYVTIGPTIKDKAIVYDPIESVDDFPIGLTDEQDGGAYRLKKREDNAVFGYVLGPYSWKRFLLPSALMLWQAKRKGTGFHLLKDTSETPRYAFIGARPCELAAIKIHDTVFTSAEYIDISYKSRRENSFIVAVNCAVARNTCFCVSMKTGPKATSGFDIALTELIHKKEHYFLTEAGSADGIKVLSELPFRKATEQEIAESEQVSARTAQSMGRIMDTSDVKELLYRNTEHPHWNQVATRCLTCGNCTLVCPTCFCVNFEDTTDLTGKTAERWRKWDSCFTLSFSYIHGGSVRTTPEARYRHWINHKLATWQDQFGMIGCVGCGRCITWCPVGIDITEEVRAIRENEKSSASSYKED